MKFIVIMIALILESVILVALGSAKKLTRIAFIFVALLTSVLAIVAAYQFIEKTTDHETLSQKDYLYMAGKLIEGDYYSESLSALALVNDPENEEYGVIPLRGLAYNENEAFLLSASYLERMEDENCEKVYKCSVESTKVEEDLKEEIVDFTIDALDLSESESEKLDELMWSMFLDNSDDKADNDQISGHAKVRTLVGNNQYSEAFDMMKSMAAEDPDESVLLAEMYVRGYDNRNLSADDEEYDLILQEITKAQVEVTMAKQQFITDSSSEEVPEENKEYFAAVANYSNNLEELSNEALKRAAKYLDGIDETRLDDTSGFKLEKAYIYFRLHDEEEAEEYLDELFDDVEENYKASEASLVKKSCKILEDAFSIYIGDSSSSDFNTAFDNLMNVLFGNVFVNFSDNDFKYFIQDYLKKRIGGIMVSDIDSREFPTVTATVYSTDEEIIIDSDTLVIEDTGESVEDLTIEKKEVSTLSVCYVLDVSGSMSGVNIIEAKNSIRQSAIKLSEDTEVGLVSFESQAKINCTLTTSKNYMIGMVEALNASGGTNIASGLSMGCDVLESAQGAKVIILLSDGHDGSKAQIDAAISKANAQGIPVYTIGIGSCDKEYLSKIANKTGGVFIQVDKIGNLENVYGEIQSFMQSRYYIKYTVTNDETQYRYIVASVADTPRKVRKIYKKFDKQEDGNKFDSVQQEADYFVEVGGTSSNGGGN